MAEDERHIDVVHAPYFQRLPITGVMGAPTPRGGLLSADFITERFVGPSRLELRVKEGGHYEPEDDRSTAVERVIHFSALMTPETAASVGVWLIASAIGVSQDKVAAAVRPLVDAAPSVEAQDG